MKKNTPYNYAGPQKEIVSNISKTVPDLTLTMRQILHRHNAGLPTSLGTAKPMVYDSDLSNDESDYYPDPRTLDLVDIETMRANAENEIAEVKEKLQKLAASKKQAQIEARQKAAREKAAQQKNEQESPKNWTLDQIKAAIKDADKP